MSQLISIRARKRGPRGVGCEQRQMEGLVGGEKEPFFPSSKNPFHDTKQLQCWVCYSHYDTSEKCL